MSRSPFAVTLVLSILPLTLSGCSDSPPTPATPVPPPVPVIGQPVATPPPVASTPGAGHATEKQWKDSCARARQLVRALHSYHDAKQHFPPAIITDAEGKPLYSWRVELLPFVGRQDLYDRFDKAKPWDAPENAEVIKAAVDMYKSPADSTVAENGCNYFVVVGPECALQAGMPMTSHPNAMPNFIKCMDGVSNTVCLIEVASRTGSWAAPIDFPLEGLTFELGTGPGQFNSRFPKGVQVTLTDSATVFIPQAAMRKFFETALVRNDGQITEFP